MMGRSVYLDQKGETKVKDPMLDSGTDIAFVHSDPLEPGPGFVRAARRRWGTYGVKFEDAKAADGWQLISWAEIEFYRERFGVTPAADELAEETTLS